MPALVVAVLLSVAVLTGGGSVFAAQSTLPGDLLYPVKTGLDQVSVTLAQGDQARAAAYLTLAERRLDEAEALIRAGRWEQADIPGTEARRALQAAGEIVDRLDLTGEAPAELRARLDRDLARYAGLAPAPTATPSAPEPQPTQTPLPTATPPPSPTATPLPSPTGTASGMPGWWNGSGSCPDCSGWGPWQQNPGSGSWSGPGPAASPSPYSRQSGPMATPSSGYPMDGQRWMTPTPTGSRTWSTPTASRTWSTPTGGRTWSTPTAGTHSGPMPTQTPRPQPTWSAPRPTPRPWSDQR